MSTPLIRDLIPFRLHAADDNSLGIWEADNSGKGDAEVIVRVRSAVQWKIPSVIFRRYPDGLLFGAFVDEPTETCNALLQRVVATGDDLVRFTPRLFAEWCALAGLFGEIEIVCAEHLAALIAGFPQGEKAAE